MRAQHISSFGGLGTSWDTLAEACPTAHPQYLAEWLEPWWDHLGRGDADWYAVEVRDGSATVAVAPLMLTRRRARGLVALRELRWIGEGLSDQSDVLSARDHRAAGETIGRHLLARSRDWDELRLAAVPAGSPAVAGVLKPLADTRSCDVTVRAAPSYYVDTSTGDWEAYLLTTSKKFVRRDLPRVRRRLAELGEVHLERDACPCVGRLLAIARDVHGARQRELGRPSILDEERQRAFLRDALEGLRRRGLLTAYVLRVGGKEAAYLIGFEMKRVFYAWNMAHHPDFGGASPGKALWASAIQRCFEAEHIDEFNMMRGDTEYKLKWTRASHELLDIRVRNLTTARSATLNALRRRQP
jgi:CelD/BcsL family acetyltransferase involved in cellulose biosynthesis